MSKKLLMNLSAPTTDSNCVATILSGYPIVINNANLCLECGATIESILAEGNIGVLNENGVYEIVIFASNAPYIFGKGGRLNANS
jgi:hypothetical protein